MTYSAVKKLRVLAGLNQTEVAKGLGVSPLTYQRWESGLIPVPSAKINMLAKIFETTADEVRGKPKPFDFLGINDAISEADTYYGEVAFHFSCPNLPLLLPISIEMHGSLMSQLQESSGFIMAESLDNQIVFIRRSAISDVYFSSDACDDYGPETYEDYVGVYPPDDFWRIAENADCPEIIESILYSEEIEEILSIIRKTDAQIDRLIETGEVAPEDREKVKKAAAVQQAKFYNRAKSITWQLSSGRLRRVYQYDNELFYNAVNWIEDDDNDTLIYLPTDGYHRSIFINKNAIDFIAIPAHKFKEAEIDGFDMDYIDKD